MLYTPESVRARIRNQDGRRVFYLTPGDQLTPSARAWLEHERVEILSVKEDRPLEYKTLFGAVLTHKPEHMTHLHGSTLVFKDHPRIQFRGMIDALQSQILLCQRQAQEEGNSPLCTSLGEALGLCRQLMRCDVLNEPLQDFLLAGLDEDALRERSHHPERFYMQSHFMPEYTDTKLLLQLNCLRTLCRQAELSAYQAFRDPNGNCDREDILKALNRLSSFLWILMIQLKAKTETRSDTHV